jgi:putative spermidine/putrescine transport system permease protein
VAAELNTTIGTHTPAASGSPGVAATLITDADFAAARRELRRRRVVALLFVVPLLLFLSLAFVAPIGTMLLRSIHSPVVSQLIPDTIAALADWDGTGVPDEQILNRLTVDLRRLAADRTSGRLASEVNRVMPGASSIIQSTARRMREVSEAELEERGFRWLLESHQAWGEVTIWRALRQTGRVFTEAHYLTALDLQRSPATGAIQARDGPQIYIRLYLKSLRIAITITILALLLGYPLAYFMAHSSTTTANILLIFVLLPFWTSLLVRTTSWIALLQTNGVVNSTLMAVGMTSRPLTMLYTEFATVIAMTHILLPFMILPLFSVMKGIDPSYLRAAMSLGAKPIAAFLRIYFPMTLPGVSAGALLVFIISVGYYITPALVGGTDGQMIANLIAFHMQQSLNWALAAALGSLLLMLILILYWVYDQLVGVRNMSLG